MILKRGLIVFLLVVIVFSVCGVQWKTLESDIAGWEDLQPGDILFVDIHEGWCHGGFWDHVAIYVGVSEQTYGIASVVEATFNAGVVPTPISEFLSRDEPAKLAARRLTREAGDKEIVQKAVDYALAQVGKPFDFTVHLTTVPHKINENYLHCSELVWRAYKAAGVDIDSNDGLLIYPDDIYFSPKLEPI